MGVNHYLIKKNLQHAFEIPDYDNYFMT